MNSLVGEKVAIISDKPQTTRNRIVGVVHEPGFQLVFLDTPGMHKPKHKLGEYMVKTAMAALEEVEVVLFMVDGTELPGPGDRYIAGQLVGLETPVVLAVNKVDQLNRLQLAERLAAYAGIIDAAEYIPVSALTGDNLDRLRELLKGYLPEGPRYFPEDMITDQPEAFIVSEVVREKILQLTREEIPHSVGVIIEELAERENGMLYARATIYVERESQKGIIIGRGGDLLKEVGRRAREELEALFGSPWYLDLWVKVRRDWRNRQAELRRLGYVEE